MTTAQRLAVVALFTVAVLMVAVVVLSMAVAGEFDHTDGRITTYVGGVWR